MPEFLIHHWNGEELHFHRDKVLYLPKHQALLIADLHLGKTLHFRKNGLPIPAAAGLQDLHRLDTLIQQFEDAAIYFLGDLFHSEHNNEHELFYALIRQYANR
ncbi:MAG: phosphoesterase, partial [Bacteroidota bacterium]|nr:phosphoesterase [Bacteroidota bacterium]MDX5429484.1 phosphoesterase [Bacteroidota bacterium]MDX5468271.1 phosphoesterase [Bacteroidota bacterium]